MTTEEKSKNELNIATYIMFGLIICTIALIVFHYSGCNQPQPALSNSTLDSTKYVNEYERKKLTDNLNVMKQNDIIYVDRWHKAKAETKTIVDSIFISAPDTCTKYLRIMENRLFTERQIADSSIAIKDSIIGTQSQIIKTDSVLIQVEIDKGKLKSDTIADLRDSVKKQKRKSFLKGFAWGFASREAVNQGINIINKVK